MYDVEIIGAKRFVTVSGMRDLESRTISRQLDSESSEPQACGSSMTLVEKTGIMVVEP